jgi:GNAT superfamily N-acetyltransferase
LEINMNVELTHAVTEALIAEIVAMDHAVFQPSDQTTIERANIVYPQQPDSLILLKDGPVLAGYLSVLRINRELIRDALEENEPIFKIPTRALTGCNRRPIDLYIHSIVIKAEYRGRGYRKLLFSGLYRWDLSHGGYRDVWADVVSPEGERAMKVLGLSPWRTSAHTRHAETPIFRRALSAYGTSEKPRG